MRGFEFIALLLVIALCNGHVAADEKLKEGVIKNNVERTSKERNLAVETSTKYGSVNEESVVYGIWNLLKSGENCSLIDASEVNCTLTGRTEEVWLSCNSLKVKYTHKEITKPVSKAQGLELTIVYWITKTSESEGTNSYSSITHKPVDSKYWRSKSVGGKYDPDYTGLEGNDLNNNYMKNYYNCSDLPEFASLNWIKEYCPNGYDGVLIAIDKITTVESVSSNFYYFTFENDESLAYIADVQGNEIKSFFIEKVLKVEDISNIINSMDIRTHHISNYTLITNNLILSNCSAAHIFTNDSINFTYKYVYQGGIKTDDNGLYTNYTIDVSCGNIESLSGVYMDSNFTGAYDGIKEKDHCLDLPPLSADEILSFTWLKINCNSFYKTLLLEDPMKDSLNGVGSFLEKDNDDIYTASFALRRYNSERPHEYANEKNPFTNDDDFKESGEYGIGLINTQTSYKIVYGFDQLECSGTSREFASLGSADGVIGVDNTNNNIMYLTDKDKVIYGNTNNGANSNYVYKVYQTVESRVDIDNLYTSYTLNEVNDDYSGFDCSYDVNVNFFKNDQNDSCRCESEFISFNWVKTHCSNIDIINDIKKPLELSANYTRAVNNNQTVYIYDYNTNEVRRNEYAMNLEDQNHLSPKMMIDTHEISKEKALMKKIDQFTTYYVNSELGFYVLDNVVDHNNIKRRIKYNMVHHDYTINDPVLNKQSNYSEFIVKDLNNEESGIFINDELKQLLANCTEIPAVYIDDDGVLPYKWIKENCRSKQDILIRELNENEKKIFVDKLAIRSYDATVAHQYNNILNQLVNTQDDYILVDKMIMKQALNVFDNDDKVPRPINTDVNGASSSWNDENDLKEGNIITLYYTNDNVTFTYFNKKQTTKVKVFLPANKINKNVVCSNEYGNGKCNKFTTDVASDEKLTFTDMIYDYSGYEGEANRIYFKENYKNCPSLPEFASFRWLQVNCRESIEKMVTPFLNRFVGDNTSAIYLSTSIAKPHNGTVFLNCGNSPVINTTTCDYHPIIIHNKVNITKSMLIESSVIPEGNGCKLEEKNLKDRETGERYDLTSYLTDYMVGKKRVVYNLDGSVKLESTLFCTTSKKSSIDGKYSIYESGTENYVESKIVVNDYVKSLFNKYGCSTDQEEVNFEWIYLHCLTAKNDLFDDCDENPILVGQKGNGFIALPIKEVKRTLVDETKTTPEPTETTAADKNNRIVGDENFVEYEQHPISSYIFVNTDKVYTIKSNKAIVKELSFSQGDYLPIPDSQGAIGKWMTEVDLESLSATKEALVYEYTLLRKPLTVKIVKFVESVNKESRYTIYNTFGVDEDYSGYMNNNANRNYIENICKLNNLPEFMSFKWIRIYCQDKVTELINQMSSRYVGNKVEIGRLVNSADGANIMMNGIADVDKFLHVEDIGTVRRNQMITVVGMNDNDNIIDRSKPLITILYGTDHITYVDHKLGCYRQISVKRVKNGKVTTFQKGSPQQGGSCNVENDVIQTIDVALRYEGGINAYKVKDDKIVDSEFTYEVRSFADVDNEAKRMIETIPSNTPQAHENSEKDYKEDKSSSIDHIFMILTVIIVMGLL